MNRLNWDDWDQAKQDGWENQKGAYSLIQTREPASKISHNKRAKSLARSSTMGSLYEDQLSEKWVHTGAKIQPEPTTETAWKKSQC